MRAGHDAGRVVKRHMPSGRRQSTLAVPAVMVPVLLVVGIWLGGHPSDLPEFMRDAFVADESTRVVDEAIKDVSHDYYRPVPTAALTSASIAGLVASLHDRFSTYLTPAEFGAFGHSDTFSGIGIDVAPQHRGLLIGRVFDNSPASRAGLKPGELIIAVNGRSLVGLPPSTSTRLIMGRPGTDVTLTVKPPHAPSRKLTLTRATVTVPVVASETRTVRRRKFGIVALDMFSSGAHADVGSAVQKELRQGVRGLVLDLRQNGGGLIEEARLVASIFIAHGVIVTTRGRSQPTMVLSATGDAIAPSIPMAVLVDSGTASASEIVTAALQDHHRATVVGTHTFGKGVFQEVRSLPNGGALDITVGEYFTPNGRNLGGGGVTQGAGITPDVSVPATVVDTDSGVRAALRTVAGRVK